MIPVLPPMGPRRLNTARLVLLLFALLAVALAEFWILSRGS